MHIVLNEQDQRQYHRREPHGAILGIFATIIALLLAACTTLDASLLPDFVAEATATACGCFPYGSYPHSTPSSTSTPTGTWVPPTRTPTFTPTRPPACDFCTLPPMPTETLPAWPPPAVTCTPRPDQPTLTARPTEASPLFPTLPPNTPLPAVIGNTNPVPAGSFEGEALPGGVAIDAHTGQPYVVWSQLNPDAGQEQAGRVYLKTTDPSTGQWLPAVGVNGPGSYKIGKSNPESAVGVAADGTIYVVYVRSDGDTAYIEWRASTDRGASWSVPSDFLYPSSNDELYNVRLAMDAAGEPHVVALVVQAGCDPDYPCGDIVYYERHPDGSWAQERRPVDARGARQYSVALTTYTRPDGSIRTVLGWNEDQVVYASYKDGPGGTWATPQAIIDGNSHPYGIPDYEPGFGGTMRLLAFSYQDHPWVYFFWSLYSTGRICYVFSQDGGQTWSGEDALAYEPISPIRRAHLSNPVPFFDAAHGQVVVIYIFAAIDGDGGSFPVYAYATPGAGGQNWTRYEDPTHEPLRLFRPTMASHADQLRGSDQAGAERGTAYLIWREATGAGELYLAQVALTTLFSATGAP